MTETENYQGQGFEPMPNNGLNIRVMFVIPVSEQDFLQAQILADKMTLEILQGEQEYSISQGRGPLSDEYISECFGPQFINRGL